MRKVRKMISLTTETYEKLTARKREGQSYEGVIKELLKRRGKQDDRGQQSV
jgi:predicted CopG family antitoxin